MNLALTLTTCMMALANAPPPDLPQRIRSAVETIAPSIVTIETVGGVAPRPGDVPSSFRVAPGPTTGFIVDADGLILTSNFAFTRAPAVITVRLADGTRHNAKLLATDELHRLALLKIDRGSLPVPQWADEDAMHVGQWAVALGEGFGGSSPGLSVGILSGLNRMQGHAIQTDAKLSPANYGGPLIDLDGRVLGVIVPMSYTPAAVAGVELYDSGIGFAVPASYALPSVQRLARGKSNVRGVLGVQVDPHNPDGVVVRDVLPASPATAAGIQPQDRIIAINDEPTPTWIEMQRNMAFRAAGEPIAITLRRGDQTIYTDATLAAADLQPPEPSPQP